MNAILLPEIFLDPYESNLTSPLLSHPERFVFFCRARNFSRYLWPSFLYASRPNETKISHIRERVRPSRFATSESSLFKDNGSLKLICTILVRLRCLVGAFDPMKKEFDPPLGAQVRVQVNPHLRWKWRTNSRVTVLGFLLIRLL